MSVPALHLANVCRTYRSGENAVAVLQGADLSIEAGEMVALVAPSGAGKSTLLHIAGLLEHPDEGEVFIGETATAKLDDIASCRNSRPRKT